MEDNHGEVLLKVEHLCQYFKSGSRELKAVDDVSFDIKKGEVFGLVGESGCGKTTTGRSIIKLYNITSGNVYFTAHLRGNARLYGGDQGAQKKADRKKRGSGTARKTDRGTARRNQKRQTGPQTL